MTKKKVAARTGTKKVVKKRPTKKPTAKKPAAKKTAAKKTAAKKAAAKKTAGKKATVRKKRPKATATKKRTTKKTAARKKTVKKTTTRKKPVKKTTTTKKKPVKKTAKARQVASKTKSTKQPRKKSPSKNVATAKKPTRKRKAKQTPAKRIANRKSTAVKIGEEPSRHRGGAPDQAGANAAAVEPQRPAATLIPAARRTPSSRPTTPKPAAARGATTANKPVIFLAFANDRDDTIGYLRNLPDEARRIRAILESAEQAGLCDVVVRTNSTAQDIFKVFQDPRYRDRVGVFHYGGHANGYQLLLETAEGQAAAADAGGLAAFLGQQDALQLAFLNGCSTQQQTRALLDANVSAVISTSRAIDDLVATDFSCQFYQGLAGGANIHTAYNEAAAAVQTAKGGDTRALYFDTDEDTGEDTGGRPEVDRWPWNLYLREGAENADQWNLPEAADDPLFGLPALPEQDLPESPYRHLHWFKRRDAEVFFGRGRQVRELYDRLTAPHTAPITLFYGQSGVGKSSILDAGLIPRLEPEYEVRYLRRGEGGLLDTLRLAFLPEAPGVPIEAAWRVKEEQLGKPLIVFLDQVEELYTRPLADVPDELDQLLRAIKATFVETDQRPRGKLVLGFRKEWLAELESHFVDHQLPRSKVFLEPLDRRGIIEVVQGPARSERLRARYGLTVDDVLPTLIADDLLADRDSAIAPTLQILLTKMWAKATDENYEHPRFSEELYQHLQRDGILLRDFLNQQIAAFHEQYPEPVDSGLLFDIVARHTTPLGTAGECTVEQLRNQYAHRGALLPQILQQCQDLHLLTVATGTQKESAKATRLAHDTLAPLVREQFDVSDKPGQRARRILDNRSVDWEDDREGIPLDEADLAMVERGASGTRVLGPTEQRLLEASRALRARLQRTRKVLKIAGTVAVAIIVLFAGIAGWSAYIANLERIEADRQRNTALVRLRESRQFFDDWLLGVSGDLEFVPGLEATRRRLLEDAVTDLRKRFDHEPDTLPERIEAAKWRLRLADVHNQLGRLQNEQALETADGNFGQAEEAFRAAGKEYATLAQAAPANSELQLELANSRIGLGSVLGRKTESRAEAESTLRSSLAVVEAFLRKSPDEPTYRNARARTQLLMARLVRTDEPTRANQLYEEAASEFRKLMLEAQRDEAGDYARYRSQLATCLAERGRLLVAGQQHADAVIALSDSIAEYDAMIEREPDRLDLYRDRIELRLDRVDSLQALEHHEEAVVVYGQLVVDYSQIAQRQLLEVVGHRASRGVTQYNLANALKPLGRDDEAVGAIRAAIRDYELLLKLCPADHPDRQAYLDNLNAFRNFVPALRINSNADVAGCQTLVADYGKLLDEALPDVLVYLELRAQTTAKSAAMLGAQGRTEETEQQFRRALSDYELLQAVCPDVPAQEENRARYDQFRKLIEAELGKLAGADSVPRREKSPQPDET